MTLLKYLYDQLTLIVVWLLLMIVTTFILWLVPKKALTLSIMFYITFLGIILLIIFFLFNYHRKKKYWNQLESKVNKHLDMKKITIGSTFEEKFYQHCINNLQDDFILEANRLNKKNKEYKDFIDSWVHEIKIPLASFNLLIDAIEFDIPDDKFIQLQDNLQRMDNYVEQVMYYSRLDDFSKDYLVADQSLLKIVQTAIKRSANYFIQKHINLDLTTHDEIVLTDEKWLLYIINQIISNAIKYTDVGGTITVKICKNKTHVILSISDNGIGIPKCDLDRVFEKGFTGNNGRNQQISSTGLGLYLANQLSKKLGHKITITSTLNKGTKVSLLFPTLDYYSTEKNDFL